MATRVFLVRAQGGECPIKSLSGEEIPRSSRARRIVMTSPTTQKKRHRLKIRQGLLCTLLRGAFTASAEYKRRHKSHEQILTEGQTYLAVVS